MNPNGVATFADWAQTVPCIFGDHTQQPGIVFVHTYMLPHFVETTLQRMNKSWAFVLVTGGTDRSIPNNSMDVRYNKPLRGFERSRHTRVNNATNNIEFINSATSNNSNSHVLRNKYRFGNKAKPAGKKDYWSVILDSPQVIRWYAENIDRNDHWKFLSIPTGSEWNGADSEGSYGSGENSNSNSNSATINARLSSSTTTSTTTATTGTSTTSFVPIASRPLRVMVADRVREGTGQWLRRAEVQKMCKASPGKQASKQHIWFCWF